MKKLTLCKFDFNDLDVEYHKRYPFRETDIFIYLGDISNMPDHCVVVRQSDGTSFIGYHTDNFIELTEDEV